MKRKKILFVCTGNTCRSPMAEMILRAKIKRNKIKWWDAISCGVHAQLGDSIAPNAVKALEECGYSVRRNFAPRQLTQRLIESSEVVVTMTTSHKQMLEACGNVVSVRELCGFEVPDPYGAGVDVYIRTCRAIECACDKIIEKYILENKEN